jgi:hypothetical protein
MDDADRPALPLSLRMVAWFTILVGIGTGLTMIVDLSHRHLNLNFGVLLIPAGFGLLRRDRGWRTFTLFMLWMGMIGFGAGFVLALLRIGDFSPTRGFGPLMQIKSREMMAVICAGMFLVELWQYRVLTSPVVRRLFGLIETRGRSEDGRGRGAGPGGSSPGPFPGT